MKKIIVSVLVIIMITIVAFGISYAAFSYTSLGQKVNTITTGKKGLNSGEYFDFTIKSSIRGNIDINYEIVAKEEEGNTFDSNNIYYYLTNNGSETEVMVPRKYYAEKRRKCI